MLASLGGCVKHKTCAAGEWTKAQGDAKTDSKQSLSPRRPPVVGGPGCYKSADKTTIVRICAFLSNEIKTLLSFYEPDFSLMRAQELAMTNGDGYRVVATRPWVNPLARGAGPNFPARGEGPDTPTRRTLRSESGSGAPSKCA